jgi:thymidylate synthase
MLTKNILNSHDEYRLHIDLNYYFPLFSIISEVKIVLDDIFTTLQSKIMVDQINDIIERKKNEVILYDDEINASIYLFIFEDNTNSLSMIIKQDSVDLINDFIYNLLFGSLLLRFISKLMNLKANTIDCICNKYYIMEEDKDIAESIVWVVPDVLPILKINGNQDKITDFKYEDLEFLGNII